MAHRVYWVVNIGVLWDLWIVAEKFYATFGS